MIEMVCDCDANFLAWGSFILKEIVDFVQETASRGLTSVYERGDKDMRVSTSIHGENRSRGSNIIRMSLSEAS